MEPVTEENITYRDYTELWNFNLRKIEHIQQQLETSIGTLEMKYADFETIYDDIIEQVDILSSIYSSYNSIEGTESVLRLKSVLDAFRKKYTRQGFDFNLVQNLLVRINDLRDGSFTEFPKLAHDDRPVAIAADEQTDEDYSLKPYRWITFERNRSWFIAPFSGIDIRHGQDFPVTGYEDPDYLVTEINGATLKIKDIFCRRGDPALPLIYILLDGASRNFAATLIGKQIYAERDMVTPFVQPFRTVESNRLSPGRVRLFGKNHILLERR